MKISTSFSPNLNFFFNQSFSFNHQLKNNFFRFCSRFLEIKEKQANSWFSFENMGKVSRKKTCSFLVSRAQFISMRGSDVNGVQACSDAWIQTSYITKHSAVFFEKWQKGNLYFFWSAIYEWKLPDSLHRDNFASVELNVRHFKLVGNMHTILVERIFKTTIFNLFVQYC